MMINELFLAFDVCLGNYKKVIIYIIILYRKKSSDDAVDSLDTLTHLFPMHPFSTL